MPTSRQNAIKHGLTSRTLVVLPEEHEHEYQAVLQGFRDSFHPQDAAEDALILRLAQAHWRSLRSRKIETGILAITADTERARATKTVENCSEHLNPHNALAVAFMTNPAERWHMYLRYDTTISREFFRTLDALTRLQSTRAKSNQRVLVAAAGAGAEYMTISRLHSTPEVSDFGIRSVLQNRPVADSNSNQQPEPLAQPLLPSDKLEAPSMSTRRKLVGMAQRLIAVVLLAVMGAAPTLATLSVSKGPECTMSCCKKKRAAACCKAHLHSLPAPIQTPLLKSDPSCASGCGMGFAAPATCTSLDLPASQVLSPTVHAGRVLLPWRIPFHSEPLGSALYQRPPPSILL
jgi:hypothetical protein